MAVLLLLAGIVASPPDVYLLSVDTLRADYLGCYGFPHDTSPTIDRLAESGLVFDNMVCEVPLTGPSMCSMLTGQHPRRTGVTRNAIRLAPDVPSVAETFQANGYETMAVLSNWTLKADLSGLDRGFDTYEDDFSKRRWGFIKAERDGDVVSDLALELLEERDPDKPLFAWFHWSDPHAPYKSHRKFDAARDFERDTGREGRTRRKYASEIGFTDAQIARVLDALPRENAVVIFVADHGESLFEHDYLGHGRHVYSPSLRVPLIISGPGITPGRTDVPARGVDMAPTLLALAGLAPAGPVDGVDILGSAPAPDRVRVVEAYGGAVLKVPGVKKLMASSGPVLQGALLGDWKYVLDGHREEFYDLANDPGETNNVIGRHEDVAATLRAAIEQWNESVDQGESGEAPLTDDDLKALESLGYIE